MPETTTFPSVDLNALNRPALTIERLQAAANRIRGGESMPAVASELGLTRQNLYHHLRRAGLRPAAGSRGPRNSATHLTYGIEIETTIPAAAIVDRGIRVGGRHAGIQIPGLPDGWNAQSDGSINPAHGYRGIEIVSPVLKGPSGIDQIRAVCSWLQEVGARVNSSCGLHVHVGASQILRKAGAVRNLVCLVAKHESALYASTGTTSRENGDYCHSIRNGDFRDGRYTYSRMQTLNLCNLNGGSKNTVEFRVFGGTVRFSKIIAAVQMSLGLVQLAMSQTEQMDWPTQAEFAGSDAAPERAMAALLAELRWGAPKPLGRISENTLVSEVAELARLVSKYHRSKFDAVETSDEV